LWRRKYELKITKSIFGHKEKRQSRLLIQKVIYILSSLRQQNKIMAVNTFLVSND